MLLSQIKRAFEKWFWGYKEPAVVKPTTFDLKAYDQLRRYTKNESHVFVFKDYYIATKMMKLFGCNLPIILMVDGWYSSLDRDNPDRITSQYIRVNYEQANKLFPPTNWSLRPQLKTGMLIGVFYEEDSFLKPGHILDFNDTYILLHVMEVEPRGWINCERVNSIQTTRGPNIDPAVFYKDKVWKAGDMPYVYTGHTYSTMNIELFHILQCTILGIEGNNARLRLKDGSFLTLPTNRLFDYPMDAWVERARNGVML